MRGRLKWRSGQLAAADRNADRDAAVYASPRSRHGWRRGGSVPDQERIENRVADRNWLNVRPCGHGRTIPATGDERDQDVVVLDASRQTRRDVAADHRRNGAE